MFPDYPFAKNLFEKYQLELSETVYDKFAVYADFLVEYNKNVNLTAITDGEEILVKHFLDSVLICKYCDIPQNCSLIDVGTGAGFPSVPLKIFRPDVKITLLDSLNKRITFLQLLCEKLGIEADFIHCRAEDSGKNPLYREKFDIACARAVANLSVLSEFCIPFVRKNGFFIYAYRYHGGKPMPDFGYAGRCKQDEYVGNNDCIRSDGIFPGLYDEFDGRFSGSQSRYCGTSAA